jgi:hypothetical protein
MVKVSRTGGSGWASGEAGKLDWPAGGLQGQVAMVVRVCGCFLQMHRTMTSWGPTPLLHPACHAQPAESQGTEVTSIH